MQPILVLVGGFLGAGKTTLMLAAAARLRSAGHRVAVITNDQGSELVDSAMARAGGFETSEITGGCFCCRFSEFVDSAERLRTSAIQPDVLFAEPVGSCADLAATVLRPLRRFYPESFRIAPLTVLVDPDRVRRLADPHISYLFRCQLAEADLVCFTKSDLHHEIPSLVGLQARRVSARSGEGIDEWLRDVFSFPGVAGERQLAIDYGVYADAEASLGWMNWNAELRSRRPLSPAAVAGPLLDHVDRNLTEAGAAIAHAKVFVSSASGWVKASITGNDEEPLAEGMLDASPATRHEIVLNIRAAAGPEVLERIVAQAPLDGLLHVRSTESFRPSAPRPELRLATSS